MLNTIIQNKFKLNFIQGNIFILMVFLLNYNFQQLSNFIIKKQNTIPTDNDINIKTIKQCKFILLRTNDH